MSENAPQSWNLLFLSCCCNMWGYLCLTQSRLFSITSYFIIYICGHGICALQLGGEQFQLKLGQLCTVIDPLINQMKCENYNSCEMLRTIKTFVLLNRIHLQFVQKYFWHETQQSVNGRAYSLHYYYSENVASMFNLNGIVFIL